MESLLGSRGLALSDKLLAGDCANAIAEFGVSPDQFADAVEAVAMRNADTRTVTKSVIESARSSLAKNAQKSSSRSGFKTPHSKPQQSFNRTNAQSLPGYAASSLPSSSFSSSSATISPPASGTVPQSGMKRPASGAAAGAPPRHGTSSSPSAMGSASPANSTSPSGSAPATAAKAAEYAARKTQGTIVESHTGAALAAPAHADQPFSRPSIAALKAAGFVTQAAVSRLDKAPGRVPSSAAASAAKKLGAADPFPLVCGSVQRWAEVTGMRIGLPPPPPAIDPGSPYSPAGATSPSPSHGSPAGFPASGSSPTAAAGGAGPSPTQEVGPAATPGGSPAAGAASSSASSAADVSMSDAAPPRADGPALAFELPVHRNVDVPYKYMFTTLGDKADALEGRLGELGEALVTRHGLGHLVVPAGTISQSPVVVVGRVCVDGEGKINPSSVLLEGSNTEGPVPPARNARIHLNLSEVPSFSMFPGQIIAAKGVNTRGDTLIVSELFTSAAHAPPVLPAANAAAMADVASRSSSGPLTVWVASGPFSLSVDLKYIPLEELFAEALEAPRRPDVIVLMGPFVDAEHPTIKSCDVHLSAPDGQLHPASNLAVWEEVVGLLENYLSDPKLEHTHLVLLPSATDVNSQVVYPLWPMQPEALSNVLDESVRRRITVLPDPATFVVGGVVFGATCTDVLFQLNAEDTMRQPPVSPAATGSSAPGSRIDKIPRMAQHLLEQRCFYPMFPAARPEETPLEMTQLWHAGMSMTPDILLTPSRLRPFIKPLAGALAVNPGLLVKGNSAGTYAKLKVFPQTRASITTQRLPSAEGAASEPMEYAPTDVAARTMAEIVRL